ncbi:DNA primase [Candidatus Daviesbacteria bacterium]|nr:DNA primase [Candidatus Daviesbacteria bacterium]
MALSIMDQLEEIKSKIDIVELISESLPLKRAGRNFKTNCPFHNEKTPSLIVSPERQIWHCFGCSRGGDIFRFVMEKENMEFVEALRLLAKRVGVVLKSYSAQDSRPKDRLYSANYTAVQFYEYMLWKHRIGARARAYLGRRQIKEKTAKVFKLGYAPPQGNILTRFMMQKKHFTKDELHDAGLTFVKDGQIRDLFRGRLIFPLIDHRDNMVGFAGRVIDYGEPKYFNTYETQIFHKGSFLYGLNVTKEAIKKVGFAVLVEGETDAIASYQAGVENVVATKGTALTPEQLQLLRRYTKEIVVGFDADLAGDAAARRGMIMADNMGFDVKVVRLLAGKDPDECIKKDPKLWEESIKKAVGFVDHLIDSSVARFGRDSAQAKREIAEEVLPVLAALDDEVVRAHYLQELAKVINIPEEVLVRSMTRYQNPQVPVAHEADYPQEQKPRSQVLEEYLFSLILHLAALGKSGLTVARAALAEIEEAWLAHFSSQQLLAFMLQNLTPTKSGKSGLTSRGEFRISEIVKKSPPELVELIDLLWLSDLGDWTEDEKHLRSELDKTIRETRVLFIRRKLSELSGAIAQAQIQNKEQDLVKLNKQFISLRKQLEGATDEKAKH